MVDEAHLINAVARLATVERRPHLAGAADAVVRVAPVLERMGDFSDFLSQPFDEAAAYASLRRGEAIGHPLDGEA